MTRSILHNEPPLHNLLADEALPRFRKVAARVAVSDSSSTPMKVQGFPRSE